MRLYLSMWFGRTFLFAWIVFSLTHSVAHGFGKKAEEPPPVVKPTPAPTPVPAPTPGSDFLGCNNRSDSGSWAFGAAPSGCNVNPAQSSTYVKSQYAKVIYRDGAANARADYMSALFPVAREVGTYYLKRRKPAVSAAELNGFLAGFYALLNQETFWTHYRLGADSLVRYMRGDSLHGFGIMQVDDRSHATALKQGKGVDLIDNMIYGLDVYYAAWVKSATASCVSSSTNYEERARASWSAYNGGSGSICRWTNPNSPYASGDQNYYSRYRAQAWLQHVADKNRASSLDVECLAEGARPCANRE